MRRNFFRGFTFTEILIVCVIVMVLAGLVTVALVRARDSAKESKCRNNLGQIGKSLLLYANDYDGFAPHYLTKRMGDRDRNAWVPARPEDWRASLAHYSKNIDIFYCPRDEIRGVKGVRWDSTKTSYETVGLQHKDEITDAGAYLMNLDDNLGSTTAYAQDRLFPDMEHSRPTWYLSLHGDFANFLFLDGSVKKLPINDSPKS